jgi:hypothetical protein
MRHPATMRQWAHPGSRFAVAEIRSPPAARHARRGKLQGGFPQRGDGPPSHGRIGPMMSPMMAPMGPGFAAVNDLEQLRRLYAMSGHEGDIIAVYQDVLNKTQDPMLRHYVYDSLAREQLKPAHSDQAIATLRTSLSEDLAAANKRLQDAPDPMPPPAQAQ